MKSTTCLQNFRPPNSLPGIDLDIISLTLLPNQQQDIQFIACTRSLELFIYNAKGQVLQSFKSTDETKFGDNVACEISKNGKFIYVATEKGFLMCFNIRQKSLENAIQVPLNCFTRLSFELVGIQERNFWHAAPCKPYFKFICYYKPCIAQPQSPYHVRKRWTRKSLEAIVYKTDTTFKYS